MLLSGRGRIDKDRASRGNELTQNDTLSVERLEPQCDPDCVQTVSILLLNTLTLTTTITFIAESVQPSTVSQVSARCLSLLFP